MYLHMPPGCRLAQVQEQLAAAQAECAKLKYEASVATGKAQTMTERMARCEGE
jgi:hypothetical protein